MWACSTASSMHQQASQPVQSCRRRPARNPCRPLPATPTPHKLLPGWPHPVHCICTLPAALCLCLWRMRNLQWVYHMAPPSLHCPNPPCVPPPFLCPAQHGWRWDDQNRPDADSHPALLGTTANPRSRECNHDFAGESFNAPALPAPVKSGGFMVTTNRKQVDCSSQVVIDGVTD